MRPLLCAAVLLSLASAARAAAFAELLQLGVQEPVAVPTVKGAPAPNQPAPRPAQSAPTPIYTSRTVWNAAFPLPRPLVDAAGTAVGTKAFDDYRCEYTPGAATARCDYAYDVWPEICWYGYDHVIVDITLATGARTVVKREWRADR